MKHHLIIATTALLALSACTTAEERAAVIEAQQARDHEECRSLGFKVKTESYSNCLLKLREIRAQERTAAAARNSHYSIGYGGHGGFGRYHW